MIKVVENFLSSEECKDLISSVSSFREAPQKDYERNCLLKFISLPSLTPKLLTFINESNRNFELDSKFEFIKYRPGDHFQWHNDLMSSEGRREYFTFVIFLNTDYTGGNLIIRENLKESVIEKKEGTLCIFNSSLVHKVTKVVEGERYSLCNWAYIDTEKNKSII